MRIDAVFLMLMSAFAAFIGMLVKNKQQQVATQPYPRQQNPWMYYQGR